MSNDRVVEGAGRGARCSQSFGERLFFFFVKRIGIDRLPICSWGCSINVQSN